MKLPKQLLSWLFLGFLLPGFVIASDDPDVEIISIYQSVIQMSLAKGVSLKDAGDAMTSKAAELNLRLVGRQKVHEQARSRGITSPHLEIFQFCDPADAVKMILKNPLYSAYMPCRISLVEDKDGKAWLYMVNLDMLINNSTLDPGLQAIAIRVNQSMLAVMTAGATGEF
ncbi:MAG: DUF302 domain-containing protein [gamma proteobacterium endosymbiont of Lamellibrachia anaximandri]|nr:DUF302 domain-containing protein [gamma proteobacterium endosymbiont of Lamellibrachia anaximandri]MBL3535125.1 DUF302 domain-containing protein [gamma proteobacterium endosymbiont of Lamellibrachia anaximandri]